MHMITVAKFGMLHASVPREWPNRPEGFIRHISTRSRYRARVRTLHLFAIGPVQIVVLTGSPFGRR